MGAPSLAKPCPARAAGQPFGRGTWQARESKEECRREWDTRVLRREEKRACMRRDRQNSHARSHGKRVRVDCTDCSDTRGRGGGRGRGRTRTSTSICNCNSYLRGVVGCFHRRRTHKNRTSPCKGAAVLAEDVTVRRTRSPSRGPLPKSRARAASVQVTAADAPRARAPPPARGTLDSDSESGLGVRTGNSYHVT